jgi:hypothetical protein
MGWRWNFWLVLILAGTLSLAEFLVLKESYLPILINRKVARLQKETGNTLLRSKLDKGESPLDFFKRGIIRPLKMLSRSPICAIFAVYIGIAYGYLYIMFTSLTIGKPAQLSLKSLLLAYFIVQSSNSTTASAPTWSALPFSV